MENDFHLFSFRDIVQKFEKKSKFVMIIKKLFGRCMNTNGELLNFNTYLDETFINRNENQNRI